MKLRPTTIDLLSLKTQTQQRLRRMPKAALPITILFGLLLVISLYNPQLLFSSSSSSSSSSSDTITAHMTTSSRSGRCDIFKGEWVPDPNAPYYTNKTCWAIHEHQNCAKHGRPDAEFLKWRWKPDGCELPTFDPVHFLEVVRGKSMAFVGDSVARNQLQSMICLLSSVEQPVDVFHSPDQRDTILNYTTYNFTLAIFWSPYLVKSSESADLEGPAKDGVFDIYLDEVDEKWSTQAEQFDYLIISAGHWFFRTQVYYESSRRVGCHFCVLDNFTDSTNFYGYRMAFRTVFRAINGLKNYKGITYLRTFAPSHFEGGRWYQGGNCVRTRPFTTGETALEGDSLQFYMIQIDEFRRAEKEGTKRGLKYRLLDVTIPMLLRPDGHPSRFGHWPHENVTLKNDCVHWCLPGPIDSWSDFLLEMLKIESKT